MRALQQANRKVNEETSAALTGAATPAFGSMVRARWLDEKRWVRRFTRAGSPGAMLRVTEGATSGRATTSPSCTARTTT
ncbi:hypothetical protein [Streptomyces cirratus]|uniref:hypothetical protein n=1 Tax=Streptomyces cirratus TaxID=68187 RepID=UPI0027E5926F|nr:hypothetical protein [Streptomyces cirratus]